jgi:hypothetical protein
VADVPVEGYEITDIHQGQAGDCWLLSVLGAFANNAPGELAYALRKNPVPMPGPTPTLDPGVPCGCPVVGNYEPDAYRPNWPAQTELWLKERHIDVLHGNAPETAAHALHLDGMLNELDNDPTTGDTTRPMVACTFDHPANHQIWGDHCYVVTAVHTHSVVLYNPIGYAGASLNDPFLVVGLPTTDLYFVGF